MYEEQGQVQQITPPNQQNNQIMAMPSTSNDKFEYSIAKLNGDNWQTWKWQIMNILNAKGLSQVLDSSSVDTREELAVRQILACSLDQQIVYRVIHCRTAQEIWSTLESSYENKTSFALTDLIGRMNSYRMVSLEQVEKGVSEIQAMATQIRALGGSADDSTIESAILRALPKSFAQFITSWTFLDQDKRTLNNLQAHLMRQVYMLRSEDSEAKALISNANKSLNDGEQIVEANAAKLKNKCRWCKKWGHTMEDCRKFAAKKKRDQEAEISGSNNSPPDNHKTEDKEARSDEPTKPVLMVATLVQDKAVLNLSNSLVGNIINTTWVADSGASFHMTSHIEWIQNYKSLDNALPIKLGNNMVVKALGKGTIITDVGIMDPVFYLPDISEDLFSTSACARNHKIFSVTTDKNIILTKNNKEIIRGELSSSGIYQIKLKITLPQYINASSSTLIDWHDKLGHISFDKIKHMLKNNIADGLRINNLDHPGKCESCAKSKITRCSHPSKSSAKSSVAGQVLHLDTVGPIEPSLGGAKYFIVIKDEFSSYKKVLLVENKSEIPPKIKQVINQVKLETNNDTLKIVSDQGTEFKNNYLREFFVSKGITHVMSNVYTPEQNGLVERENRTIIEAARTLRIRAKLPMPFWGEAVNTAVYVLNKVPNSKNPNSTPYEIWFNRKPSLLNLHKFGEKAMVRIQRGTTKFEAKAESMIFVGYTSNFNSFRFYDPSKKSLVVSCDATFIGSFFQDSKLFSQQPIVNVEVNIPVKENVSVTSVSNAQQAVSHVTSETPSASTSIDSAPIAESTSALEKASDANNESRISSLDATLEESIYDDPSELINTLQENTNDQLEFERIPPSSELPPENPDPERIASLRPRIDRPNYMPWKLNISTVEAEDDPASFHDAMSRHDKDLWLAAMNEELKSLHKNQVWNLVPRPTDESVNIVTNRWVLRIKRKPNGEIERYRARLVARGFSQKYGVDYLLTYAPVVSTTAVRLLLAYAAAKNLKLAQFDIKTAFLYGELEEQVLMEQPQGFCLDTTKVCELKRSLYGLKQAPRQWALKFREFLLEMNLAQSENDGCVFFCKDPLVIIAIYVDDGLILAQKQETINMILDRLKRRFDIHTMAVSTFLGFQIEIEDDKLFIHQEAYIKKILTKFRMDKSKPEETPISSSSLSSANDKLPDNVPYREAVGSLLYAAITTRIDIAYAVGLASRSVESPLVKHWLLIKRIFRYLNGTVNYGLRYSRTSNPKLHAFCDAAYADDITTARSTTGSILIFSQAPIQWRSSRQTMVTKSVSEAEYIAICSTATDVVIIRKLALELDIVSKKATPIYCDNEAAVRLANDERSAHRTRHMHVKMEYCREQIERGEIIIDHTPGKLQLADTLTKPTSVKKFQDFRSSVMATKTIMSMLALLMLLCTCTAYHFEEVSQIIYQPTDKFIDLGIAEYTVDFTFINPCNIITYQYNYMNPTPPATNQVPQQIHADPVVQAHFEECNKVFESTWMMKMREIEFNHAPTGHDPNQRIKRSLGENVTFTVITNFVWRMVERWLPWSDYNRINRLEERQQHERELIGKFSHAFNVSTAIQQGMLDMIRNNSVTLRDHQRQINHLAELTTRFTWLATFLETRMFYATGDLKSVIEELRHGRVAAHALGQLLNITDISDIDNRDTRMITISRITPSTIRFHFEVRVRSTDTFVYRVHPVRYWDNLTHTPQLMEYQGPKFVVYNTTNNCIKGIEEPTERAVYEECSLSNYVDPDIGTWRILVTTNDIMKNLQSVSIIKAVNYNYVYCFPYNITIMDGTYRCPTRRFKVPSDIGFSTFNRTVTAVKRKLHIMSDVDKLFVDDVHIGHFVNTSIATTGVEMFDRVQYLIRENESLIRDRENSLSIEKNSTKFWSLLGGVVALIFVVLTLVSYNLRVTRTTSKRTKDFGATISRDLNDLRRIYESTNEMDVHNAIKTALGSFNSKSAINNVVNPSTSQPSVEVGGDVTINVHKTLRPLPEVPDNKN